MSKNLFSFKGNYPQVSSEAFVASGAKIIGAVTIEKNASIWCNAVLRGDEGPIIVKENTNIQDFCLVHMDPKEVVSIGRDVTVGHGAIVHGCTIEDYALIGMGAIILNKAVIGEGSIIGAGAVVTAGTKIPPYSVVVGSPAKVIKTLNPNSKADRIQQANWYCSLSKEHTDL